MQRDMKLIYKLLVVAESVDGTVRVDIPVFPEYSDTQVQFHVKLCMEAGYLQAGPWIRMQEVTRFTFMRPLTWNGHEALARLRETREIISGKAV